MVYDQNIEGRCVQLRAATLEDAQFTYDIRQDKEKTRYIHPINGSVEQQKEWLEQQRKREGDYFFIIETREGMPIGTSSVYNIKGEEGETGRILLLGTPLQNVEAHILGYDFAFYHCGLKKVWMTVHEKNIHTQGNLKKYGASEQFRKYDDELKCDLIYYSLTKEVYEKKKAKIMRYIEWML